MSEKLYTATCHTKCYWLETLWEPGEKYEGSVEPNKHFSSSGDSPEIPPKTPDVDSRSNQELRDILNKAPFKFKAPAKWNRKELWSKLQEMETALLRDAGQESRVEEMFKASCGFISKNSAGLAAHERQCNQCKKELFEAE